MECHDTERLIDVYLDGELAAGQADEMGRHLADCKVCRTKYAPLIELLRSPKPVDVPEHLGERIMSAVEGHLPKTDAGHESDIRHKRPAAIRWLRWSGALAASLALFFMGWITARVMITPQDTGLQPTPFVNSFDPQSLTGNPKFLNTLAQVMAVNMPANPAPFFVQPVATAIEIMNEADVEPVPVISIRQRPAYAAMARPEIDHPISKISKLLPYLH